MHQCGVRKEVLRGKDARKSHTLQRETQTSGTQYDFTVGCFHAGPVTSTHQLTNIGVLQQRWPSFLTDLINNLLKVAVEPCFNPSVTMMFLHETAQEHGAFPFKKTFSKQWM